MNSRIAWSLTLFAVANGTVLPSVAKDPSSKEEEVNTADSLVRAALQAETNNDESLRDLLLARALKRAPDYAPARWHSGYLRQADEWIEYDKVWQRASSDERLALYRDMRSRASSAADNLALARWCRKSGLDERAKLHGMYVLLHDPKSKEATRALGLRNYRGAWMTDEQISEFDQQWKKAEEANSRWTTRIEPLRDAMIGDDPSVRDRALAQLRRINEAEAVPALVNILSGDEEELDLEVVNVIGKIPAPVATQALAHLALFSRHEKVRAEAGKQLSDRPLHEFVPQMMSLLNTPVELRYYVSTFGGTSQVAYSLEQEGRQAHLVSSFLSRASFSSRRIPADSPIRTAFHTRHISGALNGIRLQQLALHNQRTGQINQRVYAALTLATGQELQNEPQAWWQWWADYNEVYTTKLKPLYAKFQRKFLHRSMSCFVAGTKVWTESGPQPIETIRIGDRILSQDCDTGELAYKIVMQTTVRPPSKTLRIEVDGDEIWTTLGHPFWAVDQGWLMAKQLEEGSLLHSISGPQLVDNINPGPEATAHNLVVADFNTYFVGDAKVLVHDNQPRMPTRAAVPGYVAK